MSAELIVALDVSDRRRMLDLVEALPAEISWYKVGLELFSAEGPACVRALRERGKSVFLDLKLHDIPRTVARAVTVLKRYGVGLATVHASGGRAMLRAAAEAGADVLQLVAVTALTSLDAVDLRETGVERELKDHVLALGRMAVENGIRGLVCSVHEAADFRRMLGAEPLLVTPGIRLENRSAQDQKRVATPGMAVSAGASHVVVGRPILAAPDPVAAAKAMIEALKT